MTSSLFAKPNERDEIRKIPFDDMSQVKTPKFGQGFSDLFAVETRISEKIKKAWVIIIENLTIIVLNDLHPLMLNKEN